MATFLVMNQAQTAKVDNQKKVQEAFEIMASMDKDSDTAPSNSSTWQDSSL